MLVMNLCELASTYMDSMVLCSMVCAFCLVIERLEHKIRDTNLVAVYGIVMFDYIALATNQT